jgi:hypothetical protein
MRWLKKLVVSKILKNCLDAKQEKVACSQKKEQEEKQKAARTEKNKKLLARKKKRLLGWESLSIFLCL